MGMMLDDLLGGNANYNTNPKQIFITAFLNTIALVN